VVLALPKTSLPKKMTKTGKILKNSAYLLLTGENKGKYDPIYPKYK
jgi:hypothetical protein